ncbi:MAG: cytochrome oxidase small assembly protein [Burkholderiales bacterium]
MQDDERSRRQRKGAARTALILASIAGAFFVGYFLRRW